MDLTHQLLGQEACFARTKLKGVWQVWGSKPTLQVDQVPFLEDWRMPQCQDR